RPRCGAPGRQQQARHECSFSNGPFVYIDGCNALLDRVQAYFQSLQNGADVLPREGDAPAPTERHQRSTWSRRQSSLALMPPTKRFQASKRCTETAMINGISARTASVITARSP